jgi:hypothetical protein
VRSWYAPRLQLGSRPGWKGCQRHDEHGEAESERGPDHGFDPPEARWFAPSVVNERAGQTCGETRYCDARAFATQASDVLQLARDVLREQPVAGRRDDDLVLDADAEAALGR